MHSLEVSDVHFAPTGRAENKRGFIGFVSFTLGRTVVVDCVTVRRTLSGQRRLSFPVRRDRAGRDHSIIRPLDAQARESIEVQVFEQLDSIAIGYNE